MKEFSEFIAKFKNIKPPEKTKKTLIQEAIKKYTGISIPKSNIVLKHKSAQINAPAVVKQEINFKHAEIIKHLNELNADIDKIF